jgi:hypothetical protein
MKREHRATSMIRNVRKAMIPRLMSNCRTYGSWMRLKLIKVYSDSPIKARMGSSIHSYVLSA